VSLRADQEDRPLGDYMNIAAASTIFRSVRLQEKSDVSVLGLAMDSTKQTGEAVLKMMDAASEMVPEIGLGENFDARA